LNKNSTKLGDFVLQAEINRNLKDSLTMQYLQYVKSVGDVGCGRGLKWKTKCNQNPVVGSIFDPLS